MTDKLTKEQFQNAVIDFETDDKITAVQEWQRYSKLTDEPIVIVAFDDRNAQLAKYKVQTRYTLMLEGAASFSAGTLGLGRIVRIAQEELREAQQRTQPQPLPTAGPVVEFFYADRVPVDTPLSEPQLLHRVAIEFKGFNDPKLLRTQIGRAIDEAMHYFVQQFHRSPSYILVGDHEYRELLRAEGNNAGWMYQVSVHYSDATCNNEARLFNVPVLCVRNRQSFCEVV